MKISGRGERGFTLIELLIVVAILGVLAAVVIPNVGRFIGRGEGEAADTEYANVQSAVVALMVDNGISSLPNPVTSATSNMSEFPDNTSAPLGAKVNDPSGVAYAAGDKTGFILYQHDLTADDADNVTSNYVATESTKGTYTVDSAGTVTQVTHGYE